MCEIALDVPPTAPQWACRRARRGSGRLDGCVLFRVHVRSIARSACALLECWKLWNGQIGPATQATSASVSSHWLSRTGSLPSAPSHVPPAAPPPVAAAAGGLTGVGGGADMTGRRGVRFARFARWAPSGTHLFLGIAISWTICMFTPSCCQGRFCSHCAHSHLTSPCPPPIFILSLSFRSKPRVCTYFGRQPFLCWDQTPMQVWPPNNTPYHPHGLGRVASLTCSAC